MTAANANLFHQDEELHAAAFFARGEQLLSNFPIRGRTWFLDANTGAATADARSFSRSKLTMADIFDELSSGDRVYFTGKIKEQLATPVGIFDVSIFGAGNRPRHADQHTGNNGYTGATWAAPASPTATTALCRVQQQGWRFGNILWAAHTDYGALEWVRNAAAGDSERDASHGHIVGCRFAAGKYHVMLGATSFTENLFNLRAEDNDFEDATTMSWFQGGGGAYRCKLLNNRFMANVSAVDVGFTQSIIRGNMMGLFTTKCLDLTGGANNIVTGNYFTGDYSTAAGAYVAGTTDNWFGNFATDVAEAEVDPNGLTTADPAA